MRFCHWMLGHRYYLNHTNEAMSVIVGHWPGRSTHATFWLSGAPSINLNTQCPYPTKLFAIVEIQSGIADLVVGHIMPLSPNAIYQLGWWPLAAITPSCNFHVGPLNFPGSRFEFILVLRAPDNDQTVIHLWGVEDPNGSQQKVNSVTCTIPCAILTCGCDPFHNV